MIKNGIAVVTVIYEKGLPFFKDYFASLENQKNKNFDLLLFGGGISKKSAQALRNHMNGRKSVNYQLIDLGKLPLNVIWTKVMAFLIRSKYEKIIFADLDDYFRSDRVAILAAQLNKSPLVFHDLNLFYDRGDKIVHSYFKGKMPARIDWRFILDKNCLGLGNSAIRRELLFPIRIPKEIKAIDWYLFMNLMLKRGVKARFIPKGLTYYRQHVGNISGISDLTSDRILNALEIKRRHYYWLLRKFRKNHLLLQMYQAIKILTDNFKKDAYLKRMQKEFSGKRTFWWEYARV